MNEPAATGTTIVQRQPSGAVEPPRPRANHPLSESSSCHPQTADLPSVQSNFDMLFNLAPVGYLIAYEDMAIREVNRTAESLLGVSRQELLGNPLILYVQVQFRESLQSHFRRVFSGREESIELSIDHAGESVPIQLHSTRIPQTTTHRPCCLCSLIDLSGRKNSQDEILRHQARMKSFQIEQAKRLAELQDRLLEESTTRRKAQQEARLHSQTIQERSEELDRLRRELSDQTAKQSQTEQHLARLQQHLTRLTRGLVNPDDPPIELKPSLPSVSEELPSPEYLHQIHHRLLGRIEKLETGVRRRQTLMEPKSRFILRLLAQLDRVRTLLLRKPEGVATQSLEHSLRTCETLLQKTCRLNTMAAWQLDPDRKHWVLCTGLALLMGIRKDGFEPDFPTFYNSIIPEDRLLLEQILQPSPSSPSIRTVDIRFVRKNGTIRYLRHTIEPLLQSDKTFRLSAAVVDITAWKKSDFQKTRCFQRIGRLGRDQIEGLSIQRDQLLLEQSILRAQLEDSHRQRHVLETRIEALQKDLASLRRQNQVECERNRQLVSQFQKHKERLTRLVGERTSQIVDIRRSVEIHNKRQQARIVELTAQLDESRSLVDQHLRRYEQLQQRMIQQQQAAQLQVANDRESYSARIRELNAALASAQKDTESHRRDCLDFQSEFADQRECLLSSLIESEATVTDLENNLEHLRLQYDSLALQASEEIDRLNTELAQTRRAKLAADSEHRTQIQEAQIAQDNAVLEIQKIQQNLDLDRQTIIGLQEQLQALQRQSRQDIQVLQSDLGDLSCLLDESMSDLAGFAAMIRNDLRHFLTGIRQMRDNSEGSDFFTNLAELGDIADILLRTGRIDKKTDVDTRSLVTDILDSLFDCIEQTGTQIELGQLPPCPADADLLARLFFELIDNALKFLSSGRRGQISIIGWIQDGQWICQIEDNGIGMRPDQIDRAFQFGVQLSPGTPGRGLGLTLVRRIVNLHNGSIQVESHPGNGTRILLMLPMIECVEKKPV